MNATKFSFLCVMIPALVLAQGRGWNTFGGDAQRTGWNRGETDLAPDNIKGLKIEWGTKLNIAPRGLNGLTVPIARANMSTSRGIKDFIILGSASDQLFVVDGDNGKVVWEKTLTIEGKPQRAESWLCPNAQNATPLLAGAPGGRGGQVVYALASDGRLHGFNLLGGEEVLSPTPFIPAFGKSWSLNTGGNVIYTTTSQGCNNVRSGVWDIDLADPAHKVSSFATSTNNGGGSGVWGRAGPAMTSGGRLIVETGDGPYDPAKGLYSDSVIALSAKELKLLDYYTPANRTWITKKDLDMGNMSAVVFPFKNRELVASGGKEGVIYLLDSKNLGRADHRTPLYRSPLLANEEVNFSGRGFWGAFSTWEEAASGTRWLLVPAWGPPTPSTKFPVQYGETPNGSVMAFKVEQVGDKPVLTPAWNSVDMNLPTPVVIANGMIFALADGDYGVQFGDNGNLLSIDDRKTKASHAILYVLDALTGKTLYSSGDLIKGFSHFSGLLVAGGRVYVGTYDGTLYAFGLGQPQ
jgi:outer membrane protein assembly factor BamB